MKSRKRLWISALCLLSALIIAVTLRVRPSSVHAAHPSAEASRAMLDKAAGHLMNASLRSAVAPDTVLLSDEPNLGGVSAALQHYANPYLPPIEEFTLTPPNASLKQYKTTISVRFESAAAEGLQSQIPMVIGNQPIVLQRSEDDSRVFSTLANFNWQSFAKEQQQRKELAQSGQKIPVFNGRHFAGMEPMQFIDPEDIWNALRQHQSIQFPPQVLDGGAATTVIPSHELEIISTHVVEDTAFTWDPCDPGGTSSNPWTFATLMTAIRNQTGSGATLAAEQMLKDMLSTFQGDQHIKKFVVPKRTKIGTLGLANSGLLGNWPIDPNSPNVTNPLPSLANAPVRLNAIVNRIDLANNTDKPGGELRFVFGIEQGTGGSGCQSAVPFNIILEYDVPVAAAQWALDWDGIKNKSFSDGTEAYQNALLAMTNQVVAASACASLGRVNGSCLSQIRTNEEELSPSASRQTAVGVWEQRQFELSSTTNSLATAMINQTPDGSFNAGLPKCSDEVPSNCGDLTLVTTFINENLTQILNGTYVVPQFFPTGSQFLGGGAFNGPDVQGTDRKAFWKGNGSPQEPHTERVIFSENTCNGCHGRETETEFQQVVNRAPGSPSPLSAFLVGCNNGGATLSTICLLVFDEDHNPQSDMVENVQDPVATLGAPNQFGNLLRRVKFMQNELPPGIPGGGDMLRALERRPVNFVH